MSRYAAKRPNIMRKTQNGHDLILILKSKPYSQYGRGMGDTQQLGCEIMLSSVISDCHLLPVDYNVLVYVFPLLVTDRLLDATFPLRRYSSRPSPVRSPPSKD